MKKAVYSAIFLALMGTLLASQVAMVSAVQNPTSSPITSPITFYQLMGKVRYQIPGSKVPAGGVTINILNRDTKQVVTTQTGNDGFYTITLAPGKYSISAKDLLNTRFTPLNRLRKITNSNVTNVNFTGLLR